MACDYWSIMDELSVCDKCNEKKKFKGTGIFDDDGIENAEYICTKCNKDEKINEILK
jgi:hypothetical protein